MKFKVVTVDVQLSKRAKQAIAWLLTPLAVLMGSALVANATWTSSDPTKWVISGKPIPAPSVLGIFNEADARLSKLEGQPSGLVGTIKFSGATCAYQFSSGAPAPGDFTLPSTATCTIAVTLGHVAGASIGKPSVATGSPLSFSLTGPAGSYLMQVSGDFQCLNNNTGPTPPSDRAVCAYRLHDLGSDTASGAGVWGHIAGNVTANTRYSFSGGFTAGFDYATAPSGATISVQAQNYELVSNMQMLADATQLPIEIRVYKL